MGRIVSNFFISLDGVVEEPDTWHMEYFDEEMGAIIGAGMETNKAMMMGRAGYDGFAAFWPTETGDIADWFNGIPKYVISSSLTEPAWNNTTVVPADAGKVQALKDSIDGDMFLTGSAKTVRWLLSQGLLDELQLLLHPVVVGSGQRLFEEAASQKLDLVDSAALSSGVLHLTYQPAKQDQHG